MASQTDVDYFNNFDTYGFEDYPFLLKKPRSTSYSTQYRYYYLYGNSVNTYFFIGYEGECMSVMGVGGITTTTTFNTNAKSLKAANILASATGSQLPSGNNQNSVTQEFAYIKDNYTKTVDLPKELPTIVSGDAGKVLKVNSGETGVEWGTASADNPLFRITLSTFDATVFTAAATAHNAGKLVLLDDDNSNYHNMSLLGIYTDYSRETDGQGNPVPFMSFNKVDTWMNGDTSVYDGINYQLYASGNVYTSNPHLEYTSQSVPSLTRFVLNDGVQGDIVDVDNVEIAGFIDGDDRYHWDLEQLTYSLDTTRSYTYVFYTTSGDIQGSGSLTVTQDGGDYIFEDGAVKIFATPGMGTIGLQFNQNYTAGE